MEFLILLGIVVLIILFLKKPAAARTGTGTTGTTTATTPTTPINWNNVFRKIGIATAIITLLILVTCTGILFYNSDGSDGGSGSQSLQFRDNNGIIQQNQTTNNTIIRPVVERTVVVKPQKVVYVEETERTTKTMENVGNGKPWVDPNRGIDHGSIVIRTVPNNGLR